MPLEMPRTDDEVGRCGLPPLDRSGRNACNLPGVDRIKVTTAAFDEDYDYKYTSEYRAIGSDWDVMIDRCQDHLDLHTRDFLAEQARVEEREDREAKAAAKIHEAKAAYEAAIADYPGTWCDK